MKNYFAVTISDAFESRHYTVKKTVKHYLALALLLVVASFTYNFLQYHQTDTLHEQNIWLDEQLAFHNQQAQEVHRELGEMERIARMEADSNRTLGRRIRVIGEFYHAKQAEYSEVEHRLARVEQMVNPDGDTAANQENKENQTLATRMDTTAFSVQQETILHNNIPNGYPLNGQFITSKFGNRIHPVTKVKSFHNGVDIRAKKRANVRATADGIVRAANYTKLSGNRVSIRHNFGFESYYAHLHKMTVKPGDIIHKGEVVGISGNSGQSVGPHLHYEIRFLGKPINPIEFLKWEFGSHEIFTQVKDIQWPSLINLINKQITNPTLQLSQLEPISPEKPR